jgi:hypothetical protein
MRAISESMNLFIPDCALTVDMPNPKIIRQLNTFILVSMNLSFWLQIS